MSALSRCIRRGPEHIYTQNYLPCPSFPLCSLQRGRGTTCHIGGSDADGTPDVWPKHVMGEWCLVLRGPQTAWVASAQVMSMWTLVNRGKSREEASGSFFSAPLYLYLMCARLHIPVQILWLCLVTPHHPAAPQLAAPPFPAATGAPPGPCSWQSWLFGRSPTSPHWQLLPSAALSQTVLGSDKVTPPVTVSGAVVGGWRGGKETLISYERFLNLKWWTKTGLIGRDKLLEIDWDWSWLSQLSLSILIVFSWEGSLWLSESSRELLTVFCGGKANSEVAASLKRIIILFNILIIIIQGTFQRRLLTTEEKMTLWS